MKTSKNLLITTKNNKTIKNIENSSYFKNTLVKVESFNFIEKNHNFLNEFNSIGLDHIFFRKLSINKNLTEIINSKNNILYLLINKEKITHDLLVACPKISFFIDQKGFIILNNTKHNLKNYFFDNKRVFEVSPLTLKITISYINNLDLQKDYKNHNANFNDDFKNILKSFKNKKIFKDSIITKFLSYFRYPIYLTFKNFINLIRLINFKTKFINEYFINLILNLEEISTYNQKAKTLFNLRTKYLLSRKLIFKLKKKFINFFNLRKKTF